jgi:choice-of-anchor B domain-containing protein
MRKLLVLLMFPLLGFGQNCQYNELVFKLVTGTDAHEISWCITDSLGNVMDTANQVYADNTTYYDTFCYPDDRYKMVMYNTVDTGWNGATYELIDSTNYVGISASLPANWSGGINIIHIPFVQPPPCNNQIYLYLQTGDYASEISWSITDSLGNLIDSTSQVYLDSNFYFIQICIPDGCYNFNMYDTYGDGWQGGYFSLRDSNYAIITSGGMPSQIAFDSVPFCFPPQPIVPPSCSDNLLTLQLTTGNWASEISWSITDSLGNLIDSTSQVYYDNLIYIIYICVTDGCYDFNMFDIYGDGWQGGSYILSDSLGNIISLGNLQGSYSFGSNLFSVNSSCPILGCILPFASNYNQYATIDDTTCAFVNDNVNLLSTWSDTSLVQNSLGASYTDVYGVSINGGEYAVIGSTMGAHIIDVTNPTQISEVAFVPGAFQGSGVTHRDYFHMDNYLYAVCDQGTSTLQIIDISNLPNSVNVIYDSDALIATSHNLFIDVQTQKLYSTNGDVLDLSNPTNPTFLFDMGFGSHDMWVENDTGYFNCGGSLQIFEMTTNFPQNIGSLTSYPQQGYNHSGWKENDIYVFADENHGLSLKVVDVSDLSNLSVTALFNSEVDANSIAHNLIIRDNFVYVSYYHDGLQIFDISDPYNPIKAGYYDTYLPNNHNGYAGNWGVDPQLPSGIILVSDVQSGLFVLEFDKNSQFICDGDSILFVSSFVKNEDVYLTTSYDSMGYADILIMNLTVDSNIFSIQNRSITSGDSVLIGGAYQFTEGSYTDTLLNQNGCDSIVTTNLTITITSIPEENYNKKLIKIVDVLGRKTKEKKNTPLFYIFDDGTVEKRIIVE